MAHRTFKDGHGLKWEVWTVQPAKVERRLHDEPRSGAERRHRSEYRVTLGESLARGWLCFESKIVKRRLAPIPERWETLSDDDLTELLEKAEVVKSKPRRLIE